MSPAMAGPCLWRSTALRLQAAALLAAACGCTSMMTAWDGELHGAPLPADGSAAFGTAAVAPPRLEAAGAPSSEGPRGFGFSAGATISSVNAFSSRASLNSANLQLPESSDYSDFFDNGFGFNFSMILRRPAAGATASGDTYALATVSFVNYPGKTVDGSLGTAGLDDMSTLGVWIEGKTIITAVKGAGALRPYLTYGVGVSRMSDVGTTNATVGTMYDSSISPGVRGSIGVEIRTAKVGIFLDIGVQAVSAPADGDPDSGIGDAEPMVTVPARAGVLINF